MFMPDPDCPECRKWSNIACPAHRSVPDPVPGFPSTFPPIDPPHDYLARHEMANRIIMEQVLVDYENFPLCIICTERRRLIPLPGAAWGVESLHDPRCPESDDRAEPAEIHLVELEAVIATAVEAEGIWRATPTDEEPGAE